MASNKNTIYTRSLVNFLLDTKPYSRKLTEVNEIYKLNESMTVSFNDELFTGATLKSVWPYSFFSSGTASSQPLKFTRISNYQDYGKYVNNQPTYSRGAFKIGRDESASLSSVTNTFDPKALSGVGLKDCYIQQGGNPIDVRYLTEGIDVFLSKGSYSFQIKQVNGSNVSGTFIKSYDDADGPFPIDVEINFSYDDLILSGPVSQLNATTLRVVAPGEVRAYGTIVGGIYDPQIKELKQEALITSAQQASAELAYDDSVPHSAISQVIAILDAIQAKLDIDPNANAQRELDSLFDIIAIPKLPYSYADLIAELTLANIDVIDNYSSWDDVGYKLESLSPRILFNDFTDISLRESGKLYYQDLTTSSLVISNVEADFTRENYEEFTLTALSDTQLLVSGSLSSSIGVASVGERFVSTLISFDIGAGAESLSIGQKFVLTPGAKITVADTTFPQSWSIIKTNPIAYSRPVYTSPSNAYAKIVSLDNKEGQITFLDIDFPSGKLELEVISSTQLRLICESEPEYSPIITVNQVFNDGRLGFVVINGSFAPLQIGDRIIMRVVNLLPQVEGLDLYYGYDTDAYDANNLVYNNVTAAIENYLVTLDFGYDSRFIGYDLSTFNLVVSDNAESNRSWRLRALADLTRPLLMPSGIVNLLGTEDPTNPAALAKYDSDNDATSEGLHSSTDIDTLDDLQLWYSDRFALEYQDGEVGTWMTVNTNIQVGQRYEFEEHGIAFTVVAAAKPFIASRSTSTRFINTIGGTITSVTDGGDTIQFKIVNPDPVLETPASVISGTPRLIMYGEHFYKCPAAFWTITKVENGFTLQGRYTSNNLNVYSVPLTLSTEDGLSYHIHNHSLHFTIVEGRGIALGDTFTFTTYEDAPIFLVHGSVSGWSSPAKLNEWYWNGHIGFKVKPAECQLFFNGALQGGVNSWTTPVGNVELDYLREDLSDCVITISSQENGIWLAHRDGNFIGSGADSIVCNELQISLPITTSEAILVLKIKGITHDFALGKDLVILNDKSERFPNAGDFLVIERIDSDDIQLAIKSLNVAHNTDLQNLGAQTIDIRFTGSTSSVTSPELNTLANWIPLTVKFKGPSGNEVPFGGVATNVELVSPISLEKIADISALGSNLNEDVYVFWDPEFYDSYLPLNSESLLLAKSTGAHEHVRVSLSETLNFLTSAPGLSESSLFSDSALVSIEDVAQIILGMSYADIITISAVDGPFSGFIPGFDNLPYDYETLSGDLNGESGGFYDAGVPLTDSFERAKTLSLLETISPQEQLELNTLLGMLNAYLVNGDIDQTTISDFISAVDADSSINFTLSNQGFGFPNLGIATSIKENSTSSASSSIMDVMTLVSRNPGTTYDVRGYDVGLYDEALNSVTIISASKDNIFKGLPIGVSFNDFNTDLYAIADTEIIQIDFDSEVNGYPDIFVWENDWSKPVKALYEKTSSRQFLLSVPKADELKISVLASPAELFANNEPGIWYDPSDFSTMFQDAAGMTPVTAVEQPVGLILDKSQGLVLGPELVTNGDFSNGTTGWTSTNATQSVVSGELALVASAASGNRTQSTSFNLTSGRTYTFSGTIRAAAGNTIASSARISLVSPVASVLAQRVVPTNGVQTPFTFIVSAATTGLHYILFEVASGVVWGAIGDTAFIDNISVRELPGNHAFQTTAPSRPVLKQDGNGKYYLLFDGIDDWLVTPTITPGTDRVQVFAGVRKLSDAAAGIITELSTNADSNNGAFVLYAEGGAGKNGYGLNSRGTSPVVAQIASGYGAPITSVLTGVGNISGDQAALRVDGTQVASNTGDQGTGNYGNYPLYVGRRGSTSLPFNGQIHSLIVRFGPTLSTEEITTIESWVNQRTLALPAL